MPFFAKLENDRVLEIKQATFEEISSGVFGDPTSFVECQPQHAMRKLRGNVGEVYLPELKIFTPPKPFASWQLVEEMGTWIPPHFAPNDDNNYEWDEGTNQWVLQSN